jgi:hypothetical protein
LLVEESIDQEKDGAWLKLVIPLPVVGGVVVTSLSVEEVVEVVAVDFGLIFQNFLLMFWKMQVLLDHRDLVVN